MGKQYGKMSRESLTKVFVKYTDSMFAVRDPPLWGCCVHRSGVLWYYIPFWYYLCWLLNWIFCHPMGRGRGAEIFPDIQGKSCYSTKGISGCVHNECSYRNCLQYWYCFEHEHQCHSDQYNGNTLAGDSFCPYMGLNRKLERMLIWNDSPSIG